MADHESSSLLAIDSTLSLHNSPYRIPLLGFGVYLSSGPTCTHSCLQALQAGYRLIDTAQYYGNEAQVGRAIRESRIPRSQLFITSKILSPGRDVDSTYNLIKESVTKLGAEGEAYYDLFLIHSPNGGRHSREVMWAALEKAKKSGIVRDIGVSNYGIGHIEEMKEYATVWPPVLNQVELHPWCQQKEIVVYCTQTNIVVSAYSPLVHNQKAHCKTLLSIAEKHKKTTNQVLLRWSLQKGWVPLAKSDSPGRIASNADVFRFELDETDMETLDGLDKGAQGSIVQAVRNEC